MPIVPDTCLELLESPVPFLMGLKGSAEQGKEISNTLITQEIIIILLDTGEVLNCVPAGRKEMLPKLPKLDGLKKKIGKMYDRCKVKKNSEVTSKAKEETIKVVNTISETVQKVILDNLPQELPRAKNDQVDLNKVRDYLLEHTKSDDKDFIKLFSETQMFASYIHEFHKK